MDDLNKKQKLAQLRKMVDKSRADAAKAAKVGKKAEAVALRFGSDLKPLEFIPSGIVEIDRLCGSYKDDAGGNPIYTGRGGPVIKGRWVIWWGSKGCGKTTMALRQAGIAQGMGLVVGYFNVERALDPIWCLKQGVNLDEMLVWEGGNLEQNLNSMINVLERGLVDFIIIDTIHAFATKADTEGAQGTKRDMLDAPPQGRLAWNLSRFFRVATGKVARAECGVLLIGQARQDKDWEQLTGGHALLHNVSLNLHFVRINSKTHVLLPKKTVPKASGDGNIVIALGFVMKVVMDKTRTNHLESQWVEVPFLWGLGPDNFEMNVLAAVKLNVIRRAGSYYTLPTAQGELQLQGRAQLMEWMRAPENKAYYDWLLQAVTGNYTEPEELKAEVEEEEKPKKKGKKKGR